MKINKYPRIKEYDGARKKLLLTGGAGFVGHHIVEGVLKQTDWEIIILDRLDLSGNLHRLLDIDCWEEEQHRVSFIWWDLKAPLNIPVQADYVWHLAASSHVDRSIEDPYMFAMDNVIGTVNLLQACRKFNPKRIIYFSTDEVFGSAPKGVAYKEWDRYNSGNPYSAAKAGGEEFALAFANTYKLPIIVTHTMNVFGERQHPEKFIPLVIKKVLDGETVTIHANKEKTQAGQRHYIHARNVCNALLFLTEQGKCLDGTDKQGKYNIVGDEEVDNLTLAQMIATIIGKPLKYEMVDFHSSRPGHDLRYALDGTLLKEEGFGYPKDFEDSLRKTVEWYLDNEQWLR
jgi:dTDP-glucose 4,6-dehydratase